MDVSIKLIFNGNCEAAFRFYEESIGAKLRFTITWGDSPLADQAPPEWRTKLLHASLTLGDSEISGTDALPGQYEPPRGFGVMLAVADMVEAERLFEALSENGTVRVPLQETFWTPRFGEVVDQFGIPWEIQCELAESG